MGEGYIGTACEMVDVGEEGDTETTCPFEPQSVNSHGVDVIRQMPRFVAVDQTLLR